MEDIITKGHRDLTKLLNRLWWFRFVGRALFGILWFLWGAQVALVAASLLKSSWWLAGVNFWLAIWNATVAFSLVPNIREADRQYQMTRRFLATIRAAFAKTEEK